MKKLGFIVASAIPCNIHKINPGKKLNSCKCQILISYRENREK